MLSLSSATKNRDRRFFLFGKTGRRKSTVRDPVVVCHILYRATSAGGAREITST